jgi:hypothetical protein
MTTITIHNVTTGEIETREMTDQQIAQRETDDATKNAAQEQKAADKAALLTKLGISDDEAKLLLP